MGQGEKGQKEMGAGRPMLAMLLALWLVVVGLALQSTPALALSQRGHRFSFAFGEEGGEAGEFRAPSAIAVNESDGEVYVADRANNRVEQFEPVLEGGELKGERFVGQFQVYDPESIAVDDSTSSADPSRGDVYVAGSTKHAVKEEEPDKIVYKFGPSGEAITELRRFKPEAHGPAEAFEAVEGLAVEANGDLLVYDGGGVIATFDDAALNNALFGVETEFSSAAHGLAVDSEGDLYVGHESENPAARQPEGEPAVVGELEGITGSTLIDELDGEATSAVAVNTEDVQANEVDEQNDVYVTNVDTIAGERVGAVAAFTPSGSLIQRFSAPGLREASAIAVDGHTGEVFVSDAASDRVDVFTLEPPGPPTVDSLSSCLTSPAPSCAGQLEAAMLDAQVDPHGSDTRTYFQYGSSSCTAEPSACTQTPASDLGGGFGDQKASVELQDLRPGVYHYRLIASNAYGTVASGERTVSVAAAIGSLPDDRAWEMVSPPDKDGAEPEAISSEGGAIQAAANGGAISYVADGPIPAEGVVEGNRSPEPTQVLSVRGPSGWVSQDIATPNSAGLGLKPARGFREYQAFSANLALALLEPFPGDEYAGPLAQPPLSPPLEFEVQGATVTETEQEKTIYERDDQPIAPQASEAANYAAAESNGEAMGNAGYLALVSEADALGVLGGPKPGEASFGGGEGEGVEVLSATPDLSHVVFQSDRAAPGLYEWGPGQRIKPVSVPGEGEQASLGGPEGRDERHAIASDGARVFWTAARGREADLYVSDTETGESLQLDRVVSGAGEGSADAVFQTASADGSRVFFTDTQRLLAGSKANENTGPDLYVFELAEGGPLSGTLRDLTPEGVHGESAGVLAQSRGEGVIGASEDGSYVYFVADGALAPGAQRGDCVSAEEAVAGRRCNLYVEHYASGEWEAPKLIAALANEDAPDWGASSLGDLAYMTARVSPDGRYLAFMSRESLTGYDNEDVTSKTPGERVDEEVFLYDTQNESLVCASCDPSGARPAGVFDPVDLGTGEGLGLLVDRPGIWNAGRADADHWLAGSVPGWTAISVARASYQSRYLSDSGRLFFDSPDQLVAASSTGTEKVYEYEPAAVGGCQRQGGCIGLISSGADEHESAFLDASENGDDVFFLTAAQLVPEDTDTSFDVYDAHVCEASSPCTQPPRREAQRCEETPARPCTQTPSSPPESQAPPRTGTLAGPGNIIPRAEVLHEKVKEKPKPPTRAQKLANALRSCRKKYTAKSRRRQRASCEAQARKQFGPKRKSENTKKKKRAGNSLERSGNSPKRSGRGERR